MAEISARWPQVARTSQDKRRAAANGDEARVFELQARPAVVACALGGWELDHIEPDLYSRRRGHLERFRHPGRAVGSLDERFRAEDSFDLGLRYGPTRVAHAHSRPTTRSRTPSGAPIRSAEPGAGSHPTRCGAAHQEVHPQRCGPAAPAQFFLQKRADYPSDLRLRSTVCHQRCAGRCPRFLDAAELFRRPRA